jgi:mediator of RNA polymerase II transcription subunit 14
MDVDVAVPVDGGGNATTMMDVDAVNGVHTPNPQPSMKFLEEELPPVGDGQVPLRELVVRVVQDIYADLVNHSETLPSMTDLQRKKTLADWVLQTKRQVVKLLAVVKWARDAEDVQKSMVTHFIVVTAAYSLLIVL